MSLKDSKLQIEKLEDYKALPAEEKKTKLWNEEAKPYRVSIVSSSRENHPVYTYLEDRQTAIMIKLLIQRVLGDEQTKEQVKDLLKMASDVNKVKSFHSFYEVPYLG